MVLRIAVLVDVADLFIIGLVVDVEAETIGIGFAYISVAVDVVPKLVWMLSVKRFFDRLIHPLQHSQCITLTAQAVKT